MTVTSENGRFGNQFFRNIAVSLIAEKHQLQVKYCQNTLFRELGLELFSGTQSYDEVIDLDECNYFKVLSNPTLNANLNPNNAYFQTKPISDRIYQYLRRPDVQNRIITANPYREKYQQNNDCFVHVRLTDAAKWNVGVDYYLQVLSLCSGC